MPLKKVPQTVLRVLRRWRWLLLSLLVSAVVVGFSVPALTISPPLPLSNSPSLQLSPSPSLPLSNSPPPQLSQANDELNKGRELYDAGRLAEAARVWQRAATAAEGQDALPRAIQALNYLAAVEQDLGRWQEARDAIARSLQLLQKHDIEASPGLRAQALNNQGSWQLAQGQAAAALETWQQAESLYGRAENAAGELGSQINQSQALQALGFYRRAEDLLAGVRVKLQGREDSLLKVEGLQSLGRALQGVGELRQAKEVFEESWQIAERLQARGAVGAALLEIGNLARAVGRDEVALDYYEEAAAKADTAIARSQAKINQLSVLVALGESAAARELLPEIEAELEGWEPSRVAVFARVNLAASLQSLRPDEQTARLLAVAVEQARELQDPRAEAYALTQLGRLYAARGQWSDAADPIARATELARAIQADDLIASSAWQSGKLLKQQGKRSQAIAAYEQAIAALHSLRSDLASSDRNLQFDFKESVEPVYREFVSLLLAPPAGVEVSQDDLRKAREAMEALQIAEIDNFFQEACFPARTVEIDRLDSRAAVIYPILLSDRLETIVAIPNHPLRHYTTPLPRQQLEATLQKLYSSFYLGYSSEERLRLSQQVYDWLIRPAIADFTDSNIQTLVFVLDGFLQNLPMAALYDGQQYLIENYSIAISPGLQLVPDHFNPKNLTALAAGLTEARQGFPPLPAVKQELDDIAAGTNARVLLDRTFTRSNFEQQIGDRPFEIVHLATHGQFSSDPEQTFVLAWDERINVKDFDRFLSNRQNADPVELLVLSACRTATGDRRAALGLAGFALRSGARSTLATLWSVNDKSAAALMSEFYQHLIVSDRNLSKAEALRQAQLKLLRDPNYQHPYFWSPFILVGNWL